MEFNDQHQAHPVPVDESETGDWDLREATESESDDGYVDPRTRNKDTGRAEAELDQRTRARPAYIVDDSESEGDGVTGRSRGDESSFLSDRARPDADAPADRELYQKVVVQALVPHEHFGGQTRADSEEEPPGASTIERKSRPYRRGKEVSQQQREIERGTWSDVSSKNESLEGRSRQESVPHADSNDRAAPGPSRVRWDDRVNAKSYRRSPSPPVIIHNRIYNDESDSSSSGRLRRRSQPPPVVINNRIYNDHSDSSSPGRRRRSRYSNYMSREEYELERTRQELEEMRLQAARDREKRREASRRGYSDDSDVDIRIRRRNRSRSRSRSRSRRGVYMPPVSADTDDDEEPLVETLSFRFKGDDHANGARPPASTPGGVLQAWFKKQASFGDEIDTELVVINAAESFTDEGGKSVVTLYCQKDALGENTPAPRQIYWLHVRHTSDVVKMLKSLITCCPFIHRVPSVHRAYQSLALGLLDKVSPQEEDVSRSLSRSTSGARTIVARVDREPDDEPLTCDSVTFTSTPYLVFRERQGRRMGNDAMQSLLSSQYGYDVGDSRDRMQVLSETQKWLGKEILHVARLRSLIIGPEVLITWGEVPLSAIRKNNIIIDESDSRPLVTVRIMDFNNKEYYSYVKHDVSFAKLIAQITSLTSLEEFDILEDKYDSSHVNSERWATLLEQASVDLADIRLSLWRKPFTYHGHDVDHYAYSAPDTNRSRVAEHDYYGGSMSRSRSRQYASDSRARSEGYAAKSELVRGTEPYQAYGRFGVGLGEVRRGLRSEPVVTMTRSPSRTRYASGSPRRLVARSERAQSVSTRAAERYMNIERTHPYGPSHDAVRVHSRSRTRAKLYNPSEAATYDATTVDVEPTKIINDRSVTRKASRTYHLSSSESESETESKDQASSVRPSSSASRKSYVRTRSRENFQAAAEYVEKSRAYEKERREKDAVGDASEPVPEPTGGPKWQGKEAARPAEEEEKEDNLKEEKSKRATTTSLNNATTPFLMWRVTQGSGDDQIKEGSMSTMVRLLRKIDNSLRTNISHGRVYGIGYECSLEDICGRHEALNVPSVRPGIAQASADRPKGGATTWSSQAPTVGPTPTSTSLGYEASSDAGASGIVYVNAIEQASDLIVDVFIRSKSILGLFVPLSGDGAGMHADMKGVMDRYWGALDQMFRHLRFAALTNATEGEQSWIIKGTCHNHDASAIAGECVACDSKTEYDLVGALKHLHAGRAHAESPTHDIPPRPHEDPCIVWLQHIRIAARCCLFNTLIEDLSTFNSDLERILELSRELHLFIARPGAGAETKAEPEVAGRAEAAVGAPQTTQIGNEPTSTPGNQETAGKPQSGGKKQPVQGQAEGKGPAKGDDRPTQVETPALPTSLLQAFENILALFAVQSRIVLLTAREKDAGRRRTDLTLRGKEQYLSILEAVTLHLEHAREDLILSITAENTSAVRLGAVGAEYIVAMAMANVQTGAFRIGAGSSKVPLSFFGIGGGLLRGTRRRAVTWTEDANEQAVAARPGTTDYKAPPPTTSLDLLALYAAHARALDFNATLHPQRRAFLAIRALEEELGALQDITRTQWHCLENSKRIADPMSFRVTDRERRARFPLEKKVLERAKADRLRESDELIAMLHRARDLRARVKESIEVLDEGHGKAIRVFTLVTLFFLPLSFVTSFFGMNTADVRDMPQSSWIYWAIASPITISVLCSAYLYAYKWEAITRRLTSKTWLDQGVVNPGDAQPERRIGNRGAYTARRFTRVRGTRSTTVSSFGNRGHRDTWGLSRGDNA